MIASPVNLRVRTPRPTVSLEAPLRESQAKCRHLEDQLLLAEQENLALLRQINLLQARLNQWESDLLDALPDLGKPTPDELLYGAE